MYQLYYSNKIKRDIKLITKRGYNLKNFERVLNLLKTGEPLPEKYRDHALFGTYIGCRECHIEPDWLLVYKIDDEQLILILTRTGTHSDLF